MLTTSEQHKITENREKEIKTEKESKRERKRGGRESI